MRSTGRLTKNEYTSQDKRVLRLFALSTFRKSIKKNYETQVNVFIRNAMENCYKN